MKALIGNRRMKLTMLWFANLMLAWYICLFSRSDLSWFIELAKWSTYGLGTLVGSIMITDTVLNYRKGGSNG